MRLFSVGDELIIPEDRDKSIKYESTFLPGLFGNDDRMITIIRRLLQRYNNKDERFSILKNTFEKGLAISLMVKAVSTGLPDKELLLQESHLRELQIITVDRVKEAVKKDRLLNAPHLPDVLIRWKEWGNRDEVRDWVRRVVESDEKLLIFLSKFLQKTSLEPVTVRVPKNLWKLDMSLLKDLIDLDVLEKRCKELLSNDSLVDRLDVKLKSAIEQFLEEKTLLNKGKNPND